MKITFERIALIILLIILLIVLAFQRQSAAPVVDRGVQYASLKAQAREPIQYAEGEQIEHLCNTRFRAIALSPTRIVLECVAGSSTRTPTPTSTLPPVTDSPSPTMPHDTATPSGDLQAWEVWHPVGAHVKPDGSMSGIHEHGHEPPQWVHDFNEANFGHPLIYGGDERSSDMEVTHKHEAYGGFNFTFTPDGCRVNGYLRYHASSTPADRSAMIHSFEMYVRDCEGNITFNQGVYWTGDPAHPAQRMCRADEVPNGRDQYIIAGRCEDDTALSEQWYTHFINWDFSLTLLNATTYFDYGEHEGDPMNQDTWRLTGRNELTLRVEITMLPNPNVSLPREYRYPLNAWWCAEAIPTIGTRRYTGRTLPYPYWQITGAVDSPVDCPDGFLPQYNASTLPPIYANTVDGGNTIRRIFFDGAGIVEVPN